MELDTGKMRKISALMLLLALGLANALTLVPESTSISSCICETNLVKLTASNSADNLESVVMSSSGDKPWVIPGPKEFNLLPRSSKEITAFVTPDCFAVPGKYSVSVMAKSNSGQATTKIGVDVSACVQLPEEASVSLCRGEIAKSKIGIKNIARDEERTYAITVSSTDMDAKAVAVPGKLKVGVNSEGALEFSIDASSLKVGSYTFNIKAQALYEATDVPTTDMDSAKVKVEVKNCEAYELNMPSSLDVCAGTPSAFKVKLVNKGAPAQVTLLSDSNYVKFNPASGTLHEAETAEIEMTVNAPAGTTAVKITAKSDLQVIGKELKINGRECNGVEMQMQTEKVICSESGAEYELKLKNRENSADYAITVSGLNGAKVSQSTIALGKLESKTVKFSIPKDGQSGTFSATITAESKTGKDSITKEISIQKCFDFRLTGPAIDLCPCEEANVNYELINFGVKDDSYSIRSESPSYLTLKDSRASIKTKEKAQLTGTINSCSLESGKYSAVISAKSEGYPSLEDKLKIELNVRSKEQCFGIELKPASDSIKSKCEIKSQSVMVTNKGTKQTAVSLFATGGSKVTPDNLLLEPGEAKEVFVVVFPSPSKCGTEFGVDIKAESKGVSVSKQLKVYMEPEEKASATPASIVSPTATKQPPAPDGRELTADINYSNNSIIISSLPDVKILISSEEGNITENRTDAKGKFEGNLGPGTFLITLSRAGYKPLTVKVDVEGSGDGAVGGLGSIPLLLLAFLIIVAALYFVLRRGSSEEEDSEEEEEEKPKRGRKRKG